MDIQCAARVDAEGTGQRGATGARGRGPAQEFRAAPAHCVGPALLSHQAGVHRMSLVRRLKVASITVMVLGAILLLLVGSMLVDLGIGAVATWIIGRPLTLTNVMHDALILFFIVLPVGSIALGLLIFLVRDISLEVAKWID